VAQAVIVSLIVLAATGYAGWQLMPTGMRRWLVGRLAVVAPPCRAWLARLEANTGSSGCSTCKGCADGQAPASPRPIKVNVYRRG